MFFFSFFTFVFVAYPFFSPVLCVLLFFFFPTSYSLSRVRRFRVLAWRRSKNHLFFEGHDTKTSFLFLFSSFPSPFLSLVLFFCSRNLSTYFFSPLRYNPVVLSLANIRRGTSRPIPEVSLPPLHHFHFFFLRVRLVHFFFPASRFAFLFFSRSAHLFFLLHPDCAHLGNLC